MNDLALSVRTARPEDAADLARIYIESWQDTYAGVVSLTLLGAMSLKGHTARWRTTIRAADRSAAVLPESIRAILCETRAARGAKILVAEDEEGQRQIVTACLSIKYNVVPPTINYAYPDPACDLDYVPNQSRSARVQAAAVHAQSIGGSHSAVILGAPN